jgi:hypothetical protein
LWKKAHRKSCKGEMKVVASGLVEDLLGESGGG